MNKYQYHVRIRQPLLDRLIDLDPANSRESPLERAQSIRHFRAAVERDLEYLLNARNSIYDISPDYVEVGRSVLAFGLPDFSSVNITNSADQRRLAQTLEQAIQIFEPRLTGVNVQVMTGEGTEGSVRFRIDAQLWLEPEVEPITFDMVMQVASHECNVKEID